MSRRRIVSALALALVALPATALAGQAIYSEVRVVETATIRFAEGDVFDTRHSQDYQAYIDCYVRALSRTESQGVCYANTATGQFLMCTTTAENAMAVMRSINPSSHISFNVPIGGYECQMTTAYNGSRFLE